MAIVDSDVNAPVAPMADPLDLTCVTFLAVQLNAGGSSTSARFVYQWNGQDYHKRRSIANTCGEFARSIHAFD